MASLEDKIMKDDRKDNYVSDSDSGEEFQDAVSTLPPVMDGPQVRKLLYSAPFILWTVTTRVRER